MATAISVDLVHFNDIKVELKQIDKTLKKILIIADRNIESMDQAKLKITEEKPKNYEELSLLVQSLQLNLNNLVKKIKSLKENFLIFQRNYSEIKTDLENRISNNLSARIKELSEKISDLKNTLNLYTNETKNICHRFDILIENYSKNLDVDICIKIDRKVTKIFELKQCLSESIKNTSEDCASEDCMERFLQAIAITNSETLGSLLSFLWDDLLNYKSLISFMVKPQMANFN